MVDDLFSAIVSEDVERVRGVLALGADPSTLARDGSITPLMQACICDCPKIVWLLLTYGAEPNFQTTEGNTALMTAVNEEALAIDMDPTSPALVLTVPLLLAGADPRIAHGDLPVHIAARQGEWEIRNALAARSMIGPVGRWREHPEPEEASHITDLVKAADVAGIRAAVAGGANPSSFMRSVPPRHTISGLAIACRMASSGNPDTRRAALLIMRELLSAGADPNLLDPLGMTPLLHVFARANVPPGDVPERCAAIELLMDFGADPSTRYGARTARLIASDMGYREAVIVLDEAAECLDRGERWLPLPDSYAETVAVEAGWTAWR